MFDGSPAKKEGVTVQESVLNGLVISLKKSPVAPIIIRVYYFL